MDNVRKKSAGFTIIEVLVVVLMMGLIAAALVYNFKAGEKQRRLILSRDNLISALRTAQNYALAGKQIPPAGQATWVRGNSRCGSDNSPVSYWVEMTSTTRNLDIMAQDRCGAVIRVQRIELVFQTRFPATAPMVINVGGTNSNATSLGIRFTPPFGTMTATSTANPLPTNFAAFTTATINVEFQDGTRTINVVADGISGKIE